MKELQEVAPASFYTLPSLSLTPPSLPVWVKQGDEPLGHAQHGDGFSPVLARVVGWVAYAPGNMHSEPCSMDSRWLEISIRMFITPAKASLSVPALRPVTSSASCVGEEMIGGLCGLSVALLVLFLRVTVLLTFPSSAWCGRELSKMLMRTNPRVQEQNCLKTEC